MWNESLSVKLSNLVNITATIPEIYNFPRGLLFGVPCIGCYANATVVRGDTSSGERQTDRLTDGHR